MPMRTAWLLALVAALLGLAGSALAEDRQITFGEKQRDLDPVISPDGKMLAFSSNRTGTFNIYVIRFKTSETFQITTGNKDDRYPVFTADSKYILFSSERTGKGDIYRVEATGGSGFLQITDGEKLEEYPGVRPKGSGDLVFARREKWGPKPDMRVVTMNVDRGMGSLRVLAEGDEPRYSPDGSKIVFVSNRTKDDEIWMMNPDGGLQTQLTSSKRDDENPAFSPDGKRIVFASKRTGNYDIWVMDTDGGNIRQLTTDQADETQPFWSEGGYIYYVKRLGEGHTNIFRIKAP